MAEKAKDAKADEPKQKANRKKVQTVRERSQAGVAAPKRRVRTTASAAGKPFRALGRLIAKLVRPFRFVLRPFKTKPARFIGRILSAILFLKYFRNSFKELRQVDWPNRKETWKLTVAVFIFAIVFGLVIAVVDYGLDKVFKKLLLS